MDNRNRLPIQPYPQAHFGGAGMADHVGQRLLERQEKFVPMHG